MYIHPAARFVLEKLQCGGYEAYVVGGCVRDTLLNLTPKDWDVCTSALPAQVAQLFNEVLVVESGIKYGTVTVVVDKTPVEVTTFRADGEYIDHRRPQNVNFVHSLKQDLARRDFTVNALAYSPATGLVDYFEGAEDIKRRVLRAVGNPYQRLEEDGLRIARALRFSSLLGFAVADDLDEALRAKKSLLRGIAAERVNTELRGLLMGGNVRTVLLSYPDVLAEIIPEIGSMETCAQNNPHHIYTVWRHTAESIANAPQNVVVRLALLFHDSAKPVCRQTGADGIDHFYNHAHMGAAIAERRMKQLRFDNRTTKAVCELVYWHDATLLPHKVPRWLNRLGEELFNQLLQVKRADILAQATKLQTEKLEALATIEKEKDRVLKSGACLQLRDLAVDGNDLLQLGMSPGPEVGRVLKTLLNKVLQGELPNQKETLLLEAQKLLHLPS